MTNDTVGQGEWRVLNQYEVDPKPNLYFACWPRKDAQSLQFGPTTRATADALCIYLNTQQQALARAEAQLKRCGGDNCMGLEVDGVARWVRAERLEEAEAQVAELTAALKAAKSLRNSGPMKWIESCAAPTSELALKLAAFDAASHPTAERAE